MAEKEWDISGVRVGPWDDCAGAPCRVALDPLPFNDPFVAATWGFTKKGELERKYYWRAGRKHGPAQDLEDGKVKADASLREQGVILPAGPACVPDDPCFREACASCADFFGRVSGTGG